MQQDMGQDDWDETPNEAEVPKKAVVKTHCRLVGRELQ
jgi:hypothetical protein